MSYPHYHYSLLRPYLEARVPMRGNIDLYGVPHGVSVGMRCPHVGVDHDSPLQKDGLCELPLLAC